VVFFTFVDKHLALLSFWCYLVYRILFLRFRGYRQENNIRVMQSYKYCQHCGRHCITMYQIQTKQKQPQDSQQVNRKQQSSSIYELTNWMDCIYILENNI